MLFRDMAQSGRRIVADGAPCRRFSRWGLRLERLHHQGPLLTSSVRKGANRNAHSKPTVGDAITEVHALYEIATKLVAVVPVARTRVARTGRIIPTGTALKASSGGRPVETCEHSFHSRPPTCVFGV